jgi:hypothetical protein
MNRRELLQSIAAVPLLFTGLPRDLGGSGSVPIYKVIFDERFPSCLAFADEMRRCGQDVHSIRGDVTNVWYNDLYYRWKQSPVAIAGLTTHRSLFCLDVLARDAQMRLVHYAEHRIGPDSAVRHSVFGAQGAQAMQHVEALRDAGPRWTTAAAQVISNFPRDRAHPVGKTANLFAQSDNSQTLVSWLIAPTDRSVGRPGDPESNSARRIA